MFVALVLASIAAASEPDAGPLPSEPADVAAAMAKALLSGDVDALQKLTPPGFSFDGRVTWNTTDSRAEWVHALEQRPLTGIRLDGVEVYAYDDMVKRHGKPPARLSQLNFTGTRIAVLNLAGRAIVIVFKKRGDGWSPIAISD